MLAAARRAALALGVVLLPSIVAAQSGVAGVVKDTSGAVLPGVVVEATSPALIEKARTAVTDGNTTTLIGPGGQVQTVPTRR